MPKARGGARNREEPQTYEDAVEAGVSELEQGARYQFGERALKHTNEARRLLELALTLRKDDAEASYHLGRALYFLATTFDAAPQCVLTIQASIAAYRAALSAETNDETAFNLAQALVSLGEMVSDGAVYQKDAELPYWREAVEVFLTTEHLQMAMLNQASLPPEQRVSSEEEDAMTAETVIETLLALVDVLSSLYVADPSSRGAVWQQLEGALERANALDRADEHRSAGAIARAQSEAMIARVDADYSTASPPNVTALFSAIATLDKVMAAEVGIDEKTASVELVTEVADARSTAADILLRFAASLSSEEADQVRAAGLDHLKQAYDAYSDLVNRLSASVLQANHAVPSHLVPSTLSATQSARSRLLLLLAISSATLLDGALDMAIRAVEACGAGLTYRTNEKAFSKSAQGRTDWTTMKALREATLCLARAGFTDLGIIARLLKMAGCRAEQVRAHVEDELSGDAVWLASGGAEQAMWTRVIGALELEWSVNAEIPGR